MNFKNLLTLGVVVAVLAFFWKQTTVFEPLNSLVGPTPTLKKIYFGPAPTRLPFSEEKLWNLIQAWRSENNLQTYIKDQRLCDIAKDRANDDFDSHSGLYDKYSSYPYVVQENLSLYKGYTEKNVLNGWLTSSGHKETLSRPYTHSCLTCDEQCAQIFSSFSTDRNNPYSTYVPPVFQQATSETGCRANKQGCCSWHGGVCGCENGRVACCDGTLSPSC